MRPPKPQRETYAVHERIIPMLVAAVALALAAFDSPARAQGGSMRSAPAMMSATEAHAKAQAGEIVLVDIRTPDEWNETGIPASAHANNMHDDPRVFLQRLMSIVGSDRSKPIALICRTGNRSSTLQGHLARAGFTNVVDVSEGVAGSRQGKGWLKLGLPTRPGSLASVPPAVASGASKP